MTDVHLEQGRTWTFACAVDWPGWARHGKGDEAALEQLMAYAERYAAVVPGFAPGPLHVVGRPQARGRRPAPHALARAARGLRGGRPGGRAGCYLAGALRRAAVRPGR